MKALRATLLCAFLLTAIARSDTPLRLFGGISAGYTAFLPGSRTLGPLTLAPASEEFGNALPFSYGLEIGVDFAHSNSISTRAAIGVRYTSGSFQASEPTLFNVRGEAVEGRFEHTAKMSWLWSTVCASAVWHASSRLKLETGVGVALPIRGYLNAVETIVEPTGITYIAGGTTRTTADGEVDGGVGPIGLLHARIYLSLPLTSGWHLEPGLFGNLALASFIKGTAIKPTSVGISLNVSHSVFESGAKTTTTKSSILHSDTIVVVDPFDPVHREVRYIEVGRTIAHDTIASNDGIVIVERNLIRIEKHLPSPPPLLTIVVRADLDTTSDPSVPRIVVATDIASDEDVRSLTLWGIVNSDTIWSTTATREIQGVTVWSFADLPTTYRSATQLTIRVEARVTDALGQTVRARPASLYIKQTQHR